MRQEDTPYAAVVGAANLDVLGFSAKPLIPRDSNPGRVRFGAGGVGRNIADNLVRLGARTELVTALPGGVAGDFIRRECGKSGIGLEHSLRLAGEETSAYVALMDDGGDMALAVSDTNAVSRIDGAYLRSKSPLLEGAAVIAAEANLSVEALAHLAAALPGKVLCVDAVSVTKCRRLRPLIGGIHTLLMNRLEAEELCGKSLHGRAAVGKAGEWFIREGCRRIFITLGAEGVYWRSGEEGGFHSPPKTPVANATGAGDAFTAGVVFASMHGFSPGDTVRFAAAAAALTVTAESPVNPSLSREGVERLAGILADG